MIFHKSLRALQPLLAALTIAATTASTARAQAGRPDAPAGGAITQNQLDVFGGLILTPQRQPFIVGLPATMENLAPGNGPYGEIAYHRNVSDHVVLWGVVGVGTTDWGERGGFGSRQSATFWDGRVVAGWQDKVPFWQGGTYEIYGGVNALSLGVTSRAAGGGQHTGQFTGVGPTVGLLANLPIIPVNPNGTGGLNLEGYAEIAPVFGSLVDSSNYGVSGSSSRVSTYLGEFLGLSTNIASNAKFVVGVKAWQFLNAVDKNLALGGTSAANNFSVFIATAGLKVRW